MTPQQTQKPFIVTILKHLPFVEKVFLTALAIGTILIIMKNDSTVAKMALMGLGITFFLMAYRPVDTTEHEENRKFGLADLLGLVIVPKLLWISSAVSAIGIAFYLFDFGNDGYKNMLMTGGLTIGIGIILHVIFLVVGVSHIKTVTPIVFRAFPLGFIDFYLLIS